MLSRLADATRYASLLSAFHVAYVPLERSLSRCAATARAVPDWPRRRKVPWLAADLRALGGLRPAGPAGALSVPALSVPALSVPALSGAAEVIGTMYVMEGATLGGAIVERALREQALALPSRFFTSYGEERGAMWAAFRGHVRALGEREPGGVPLAAAVAAAERTFAIIEQSCLTMAT